jgi:DivIVA domain-containing protein
VPLTPTDVANKQFKIAFRGYALEEVDAFLDEVEAELARLLRDNNELKNRSGAAAPAAPAAPAQARAAEAEPAPRPVASSEGQEAALRTLLLAQRTADEAIAEAQAEAQQLVTSARAEAEQTLAAARAEAEQTLNAARSEAEETLAAARREAEQTVTSARREADTTLSTAQQKAASVDQEVAARIQAATGNLDQRRAQLETHIEELRAFEREYRTRLKAYLETQLRDLTGRGGPDDDGGAGVPAGARTAAVGLAPGGAAGAGGGTAPSSA